MGKHKKQKLGTTASHKKHPKLQSKTAKPQSKPPSSISKSSTTPKSTSTSKPKPHTQAQHSKPTIPFSPSDNILLIGEGDLSFSSSLITHHHCRSVTATVLEGSAEELIEKYPGAAEENIRRVLEGGGGVRFGVDVLRFKLKGGGEGLRRELMVRENGTWRGMVDRVLFNFPHVGGKCKDVNRQVRYNQEMLVSFFQSVTPLLAPTPGSSIIVTLFEGEPYTLWNIRDLARHCGLQVQRSFRFQADAYPGYRHARTLGVVRRKGDGVVSEGAWRGEEREARSYVFVRKGEGELGGGGRGKRKRKRKRGSDSGSESESESDDESAVGEQGDEDDDHAEAEDEEQMVSEHESPR